MKKIAIVSTFLLSTILSSAQLFTISFDPVFRDQSGEILQLALAGGLNQPQFSTIDFNNDGQSDLFVFDRNGNKVLTFISNAVHGTVNYQYEPKYESLFPIAQEFMQLQDYNADGKPDLWLYTGDSVVLYKNTSDVIPKFDKVKGLLAFDRVNYVPFNPFKKLSQIKGCLPAIVDLDGDTDIDFVTNLNVTGSQMIFNRNTTADSGFQLENIKYDIVDKCYGGVDEFNGELITNAPCYFYEGYKQKKKHVATKTILLFDEDEDGDMDLLFGSSERLTNPVYFFRNAKADMAYYKDTFITIDSAYFAPEVESILPVAPAMSFVDVDLDGVKDLILSGNELDKSSYPIRELNNSVLFLNKGANNNVDFQYEKNDFLVGEMIDFGSGCSPALVDFDADGDYDLFFGTHGNHFITGDTTDFLVYYENIGSKTNPDFQLVNEDYLGLKSKHLRGLRPAFVDIDNDSDVDLFLGKLDGTISYYENIGDELNPSFSWVTDKYEEIQLKNYAAPYFDDLNEDGKMDLLLGNIDGTIDYYENTGTSSSPVFNLTIDTFGGIIVNELIRTSKLGSDGIIYDTMVFQSYGYSIPSVLHWSDGSKGIAVGNSQGIIRIYEIGKNLSDDFIEINDYMKLPFNNGDYTKDWGSHSSPAIADLNDDGSPDLLIGNERGGVGYMQGIRKANSIKSSLQMHSFNVVPNPSHEIVRIFANTIKQFHYQVIDLQGRNMLEGSVRSGEAISLNTLSSGIYFITLRGDNRYPIKKLIKQ